MNKNKGQEPLPIEKLYSVYAEYYAGLFDDRRFERQVEYLSSICSWPLKPRILELFAGPAFHAKACRKKLDASAFCIDRSQEMRRVAISDDTIADGDYLMGDLPGALGSLSKDERFDVVLIMLYSLSYLTDAQACSLLSGLGELVKPSGCVIVELHSLAHALGFGEESPIQNRTKLVRGKIVKCTWPADIVQMRRDALELTMLVQLQFDSSSFDFASVERIYTVIDMMNFAAQTAYFDCTWLQPEPQLFPGSEIVALTKR